MTAEKRIHYPVAEDHSNVRPGSRFRPTVCKPNNMQAANVDDKEIKCPEQVYSTHIEEVTCGLCKKYLKKKASDND